MSVQYETIHEGTAVIVNGREMFRVMDDGSSGYEVYDLSHDGAEITEPVAYFETLSGVRNAVALVTAVMSK